MDGPLQFETVESSYVMLDKLYGRKSPVCDILVPLPGSNELHAMQLIVTPMEDDEGKIHEVVGGDRSYRTTARLTPTGDSFEVEVVIRYHGHKSRPATIFISQEVERIISENRY
ncbi:MAG TPA: hypothetical protein VFQ70_01305 [Candidatus Saccharimonadaceae bacterium]|nr:hypothetical protein [Candidatus Saccharimonadaceae bacterium]